MNWIERKDMRKTALSEEILLQVEKPARYIGNEVNSVVKNREDVAVRFAMCFPDVYEIGMSHLGIPGKMCGVSGSILHGRTWTGLCGSRRSRFSGWSPRSR